MTELKTLKELADEHGFPFEAVYDGEVVHFVAISPRGDAVGWKKRNGENIRWGADYKVWTLAKKQRTALEFLFARRPDVYGTRWTIGSEDDARRWCVSADYVFIKVLRTEVVEE